MIRRLALAIAAVSLLALSPLIGVNAHPGGLNAQGCHTNKKTGEYHCHRPQTDAGQTENRTPSKQGMYGDPAPADRDGPVKMSKSGICHDQNSPWYNQTKAFTPYSSMSACIRAGGRPPKGQRN